MSATLAWILAGGVVMSAIALVGGVTLLLPEETLKKMLLPLVALAAGSMMGGALFHMIPASVTSQPAELGPYVWISAGFLLFLLLEQFMHWHHCHRAPCEHHATVSYLLLVADAVHNFIGGLAVGGAFVVDIQLGASAWIAAAAHEVPQELGDFGVLVHSGWEKRRALVFNLLSGSTFLVGGVLAYLASQKVDISFLIPFAAGNFLYIAATDLLPEINRRESLRESAVHFVAFVAGLGILLGVRLAFHHH